MQPDRKILAVGIISGTIVGVSRSLERKSPIPSLIGVAVAMVILAGLSIGDNGKISGPLSILFLTVIVLRDGMNLVSNIERM